MQMKDKTPKFTRTYGADDDVKILARGVGISFFAKLGGRTLQLAVQVLLARLLGPSGFGLFALGQVVFQFGAQFGTLGLPVGIIRFGVMAKQKDDNEFTLILRNAFFVAYISGLAFGSGIILLAPWLANEFFKQPSLVGILRGFGVAVVFYIWLMITAAATRITRKMQYSALSLDTLPFLSNLILTIILVYFLDLSIIGAVFALISGYVVGWGASFFFVRKLFPKFQIKGPLSIVKIKEILLFSWPTSIASIFNLWLQNITILLLGYFVSPTEIGLFQSAEQVSMLSAIVLLSFNLIISPMITGLYENGEMDRLNELFKVSTKWGLYVSLPLIIIVLFYSRQIMDIIYGAEYGNGSTVLALLVLAQFVNTATGSVAVMLSMTGHQNRLLFRAGLALVACLGLNFWLTPLFGIIGAAISLGCGIAFLNLLLLRDVHVLLGLWPYDRRFYKLGIAAVITAIIIFLAKIMWPLSTFLGLMAITALSLVIFIGISWILGPEEYEKILLKYVLTKISAK